MDDRENDKRDSANSAAAAPLTPGLYLVGTPIGNLGDLSPRAVATLAGVSAILTEDTRRTRLLLDRFGIRTPTISCHKFNEASRVEEILARVRAGAALALVSDAGMPGISDPGSRLVTACRKTGVAVRCIPGPSSVTTAVALSGFAGSGFVFAGFAPRKGGALRKLAGELADCPVPVVFFESPYRLLKLLEALGEALGERDLFVGRELTKKFEETAWGTAAVLRAFFGRRQVKGELVVVVAPR
jgi:16S rRNA (cytidine1402-2'-O)-methyltransferase